MGEPDVVRQIEAALAANKLSQAADLAATAIERGLRLPLTLNLLAWRSEEAGDFAGARLLLDEALQQAPDDPFLHIALGAVLRKQGKNVAAIHLLNTVAERAADNPALWLERGYAHEAGGNLDQAASDFRRASALDARSATPQAALAVIMVRQGQYAAARSNAGHALKLEPGNMTARLVLARCDFAAGKLQSAELILNELLQAGTLPKADQVIAQGLLGDIYHRQGAAAEAYAAYTAANIAYTALHRARIEAERPEPHSAWLNRIMTVLADLDRAVWAPDAPAAIDSPVPVHAFLCGYPRSGTTLVETILASSENVETVEERPTLVAAEKAFLAEPEALRQWVRLEPAALNAYRQAYWRNIAALVGDVRGKIFVDMDPLKGIKLPLIARLFPHARIIVMRRDPRDVVWSCFRTNFALSAAAWEFTSLEATARHYDAVMRLQEHCLSRLPLRVHELRYDALVRDFDGTTQALCAFLDLPWTAKFRDFQTGAEQRVISTASALQVRQPLFDGTRQWERYAAQIAPIMPILQPWVTKFGF